MIVFESSVVNRIMSTRKKKHALTPLLSHLEIFLSKKKEHCSYKKINYRSGITAHQF